VRFDDPPRNEESQTLGTRGVGAPAQKLGLVGGGDSEAWDAHDRPRATPRTARADFQPTRRRGIEQVRNEVRKRTLNELAVPPANDRSLGAQMQ
jgi:hypothetical protein